MSAKTSKHRLTAYILLLINSVLWGFSPPIIKYSLQFISPNLFLFYRYLLATLIFFPIFLIYKTKNTHPINHKHHLLLALLGTPLTLLPLFYGLAASTSIESSIIESSAPIFVFLGGLVYLKEKAKPKEWLGVLLAIAGTILLTVYPLLNHTTSTLSMKGNLLIVLSNLVWAAFLILSKKDHIDPIFLSFYSFLVSIPFFLFLVLNSHQGFVLNSQAIPGITYMAIAGSIIAFWAYQAGQKYIEASEAAIFSYLKPVFTIPLAYLWLKEPFTPLATISILIIVLGVYLSEKK